MIRLWLAIAAIGGLASVAAGAIAAHLPAAGWGFAAGVLLFSFSLFGLALTGIERLGLVTPLGGGGLLIGWAALGLYALQRRAQRH
jgi:uncharacterized membrane protein YgdD (TMEM256/DUF423 family)